jgi:transposase
MKEYIATRFNNFILDSVNETEDSYEFFIINTTYTATCTCCGVESKYIHQEFEKSLYDLSYNDKSVKVTFKQRRFKCNSIRPTVHILDATKIPVNKYNRNYENASTITITEEA